MSAHYDRELFMSWAKDANGIPQPVPNGWFSEFGYTGKVGGEFRAKLNEDIREHHRLFVEDGFLGQIVDRVEFSTFRPADGICRFGEEADRQAKKNAISVMAALMGLTVMQLWDKAQKDNKVFFDSRDDYLVNGRFEKKLTVRYTLSTV